jgi:uncharacterized protein
MFKIHALTPDKQNTVIYYYDQHTSTLTDEVGAPVVPLVESVEFDRSSFKQFKSVSKHNPGKKSSEPEVLKISLGLSCNYSCEYCSQRFVPHSDSTNQDDIDEFLSMLFKNITKPPQRIQFWGGEPFVYWKTFKPLAEKIKEHWGEEPIFSVITNGTLLDEEKNEWLDRLNFSVGISHDGPGYHARGLDPLFDPEKKKHIMDLVQRLKPKKRISINAVLHKANRSRADVQAFLTSVFGEDINIGEGEYIDSYDEGGYDSMMDTVDDHFAFRKQAIYDIRNGLAKNFNVVHIKIHEFIKSLQSGRPSYALGQKCGMDKPEHLAVDLKGNVVTCQNVSAAAVSHNGESHKLGHLTDLDSVELKTATHWANKDKCKACPVLQLCKGSCMFLEGNLWEESCNSSYSGNIVFLAAGIESVTGNIPVFIDGEGLPEERKDIFNLMNKQYGIAKKKFIPIAQV